MNELIVLAVSSKGKTQPEWKKSDISVYRRRSFCTSLKLLIAMLTCAGYLHVAREEVAQETRDACARLNRVLCEQARVGGEQSFLASPVAGTGIAATRMEQLFLLARANGAKMPEDWAAFACQAYADTGTVVTDRDGDPLWPENVLPHVSRLAADFARDQLPYLRAMGALPV